jgi:hypothetical protein
VHSDIVQSLPNGDATDVRTVADCGALIVDAERFLAEFQFAVDQYQRT